MTTAAMADAGQRRLTHALRCLQPRSPPRPHPGGRAASAASAAGSTARRPQRFARDADTVVFYPFTEGAGDTVAEASGDPALTLRAHGNALWGHAEGFGPTARFVRSDDDGTVLVGPVNHDALELRRCPDAWTVEAWVRYSGPRDTEEDQGHTCKRRRAS